MYNVYNVHQEHILLKVVLYVYHVQLVLIMIFMVLLYVLIAQMELILYQELNIVTYAQWVLIHMKDTLFVINVLKVLILI